MKPAARLTAFAAMALVVAGPAGATRPADVPAIGIASAATMIIPSNRPEALLEPREWQCDRIRPEYEAYLDAGNKPEDWRFVGKTYRAQSTGETYSWADWLDWYGEANCEAGAVAGGNKSLMYIGGGVLVLALLLAAMGGGGGGEEPIRADSPG